MNFVSYLFRCILEFIAQFGNAGKSMQDASIGFFTLLILSAIIIFPYFFYNKSKLNRTLKIIFSILTTIAIIAVFILCCIAVEAITK